MEAVQPKKADWSIPSVKHAKLYPEGKKPRNHCDLPVLTWLKSFFDRIVKRYERVSEVRLLVEIYLCTLFLPFLFFKLPQWASWLDGAYARNWFDPHHTFFSIIFAPVLETLIWFLPILEIARLIRIPQWVVIPTFAFFFEFILHTQRDFAAHLIMYPGCIMLVVAYEAPRRRSILHAFTFAAVVHEAYNFSIHMLSPLMYTGLFR